MGEASWVTRFYLWMRGWKLPLWIKLIFDKISAVLIATIFKLAEEEYNFLVSEVVREAKKDIPGEEKITNIISFFRKNYQLNAIRTRELRLIIEGIVNVLTDNGTIQ